MWRPVYAAPALLLGLLASMTVVLAQDEELERLVNYPYAVGDTSFLNVVGQSVQVYRLPISYRLRSIEDHG